MTINLGTPKPTELKPHIVVIGVGGAGGNAVNNMINSNLEGVEFVACNTDAQALALSKATRKVQLGTSLTQGLGSGSKPDVGRAAASEAEAEIRDHLTGAHMTFITAGMGGGTGTGAAPVIAQIAREMKVLTVGVVTKPFHFEGAHRMAIAEAGISELQNYVDTLLVIPNQNLFRVANERTTFADAFKMADDVLHAGVRGVTDLMVMPGLINLDFADVRTVMEEMGKAMMGTGESEGEKRSIEAAEAAISNPLLEDTSMKGARGVLVNITGGPDMTLFEVDEAVNRIKDEVDVNANIIFGSTFDERMEGRMRVSIVATGIDVAADAVRPTQLKVVHAVANGRERRGFEQAELTAPATAIAEQRPSATVRSFERPADAGQGNPSFRLPEQEIRRAPSMSSGGGGQAMATMSQTAEARQFEPEMMAPMQQQPVTTSAPARAPQPAPILRSVAPAKRDPEEPFIAPAAVEPRGVAKPRTQPNAFAEAAVVNGPRKPAPSLLERMTGIGRKKEAEAPMRAEAPARTDAPARTEAIARSEATTRSEPSARPVAERAAPLSDERTPRPAVARDREPPQQLKVEAAPRMAASGADDDLLEIPAFLRRQTNNG